MPSAKEDLTSKIQGLNGHGQLTTYLYGETNEVVKGLLEQAEIKRQDKTSGELHNTSCDSDYLLTILI